MGTVTTTSGSLTQIGGTYDFKQWVRRLDRVTPNPYTHSKYSVIKSGTFMRPGDCYFSDSTEYSNWRARNLNRLHQKWTDALTDQAQLLADVGERKSTARMIGNRLVQLGRFAKAVKQRQFNRAWKALQLTPPKGWRARAKSTGDLWLEYHFGWAPLLGEIYTGIEALTSEVPHGRITVRSGHPPLSQIRGVVSSWKAYRQEQGVIRSWSSASGTVQVVNSDAFLCTQLGLTNPLSVAWELVPFSFLVDWFGNVSQVISALTGVMGVSVSNPCYAMIYKTEKSVSTRLTDYGPVLKGSGVALVCTRVVAELPGPTLHFAMPSGLSLQRGVTAVSLILQLLK